MARTPVRVLFIPRYWPFRPFLLCLERWALAMPWPCPGHAPAMHRPRPGHASATLRPCPATLRPCVRPSDQAHCKRRRQQVVACAAPTPLSAYSELEECDSLRKRAVIAVTRWRELSMVTSAADKDIKAEVCDCLHDACTQLSSRLPCMLHMLAYSS